MIGQHLMAAANGLDDALAALVPPVQGLDEARKAAMLTRAAAPVVDDFATRGLDAAQAFGALQPALEQALETLRKANDAGSQVVAADLEGLAGRFAAAHAVSDQASDALRTARDCLVSASANLDAAATRRRSDAAAQEQLIHASQARLEQLAYRIAFLRSLPLVGLVAELAALITEHDTLEGQVARERQNVERQMNGLRALEDSTRHIQAATGTIGGVTQTTLNAATKVTVLDGDVQNVLGSLDKAEDAVHQAVLLAAWLSTATANVGDLRAALGAD